MDPRVLDHYDGDVTRANIQPRKRAQILARYGGAATARVSGASARDRSALRAAPAAATSTTRRRAHPREGFPPGTPWSEVPDDWACPDCGVRDKVDFEPVDAPTRIRPAA